MSVVITAVTQAQVLHHEHFLRAKPKPEECTRTVTLLQYPQRWAWPSRLPGRADEAVGGEVGASRAAVHQMGVFPPAAHVAE